MLCRDVGNEMNLLLSTHPSDNCATLYMLESILTTLRMEQKSLQEQGEWRVVSVVGGG